LLSSLALISAGANSHWSRIFRFDPLCVAKKLGQEGDVRFDIAGHGHPWAHLTMLGRSIDSHGIEGDLRAFSDEVKTTLPVLHVLAGSLRKDAESDLILLVDGFHHGFDKVIGALSVYRDTTEATQQQADRPLEEIVFDEVFQRELKVMDEGEG